MTFKVQTIIDARPGSYKGIIIPSSSSYWNFDLMVHSSRGGLQLDPYGQ